MSGVGNVANAVIESVSLVSFLRVDGVTLEEAGEITVVVDRSGVRCLRWFLSLDATCFHARSRSDLGTVVLRCQEVVCANEPGCSPRLAWPLADRWAHSPPRETSSAFRTATTTSAKSMR